MSDSLRSRWWILAHLFIFPPPGYFISKSVTLKCNTLNYKLLITTVYHNSQRTKIKFLLGSKLCKQRTTFFVCLFNHCPYYPIHRLENAEATNMLEILTQKAKLRWLSKIQHWLFFETFSHLLPSAISVVSLVVFLLVLRNSSTSILLPLDSNLLPCGQRVCLTL